MIRNDLFFYLLEPLFSITLPFIVKLTLKEKREIIVSKINNSTSKKS